jgi:hypothetical protein
VSLIAVAVVGSASPVQAGITSPYARTSLRTLAPGITWEKGKARTHKGIQVIQVGRIDMGHPEVTLEALLSNDRVIRLERPSRNADRNSRPGALAVLATNGDVSTVGDTGAGAHPPSSHVHRGEVMVGSGCGRPSLGVDADGIARIAPIRIHGVLDLEEALPDGQRRVTIRGVNRQRQQDQLIVYTPRWGPSTLTTTDGVDVIVDPDGSVRPSGRLTATVIEVRQGVRDTTIPPGRMVLSGSGGRAGPLARLAPGDVVAIETQVQDGTGNACTITAAAPGWQDVVEVMGGNHFTVWNGRNVAPTDPDAAKGTVPAPRTNVGITEEGDILLVVVDGRQTGYSVGMTLLEMGDLMLSLGAVAAFNLDGGGSSVMARRLPGEEHITVSNRPSDGRERALTQALAAFARPGD